MASLGNIRVPKPLLIAAFILGVMRHAVYCLLRRLPLGDFPEPETLWPSHDLIQYESSFALNPAQTILNRLPLLSFSGLEEFDEDEEEVMCAVCLSALERNEQIRSLVNCRHIFHKDCLDEWVDRNHNSCPICRSRLLP
eukprot:Gb_40644 [translate_table: standard]